MPKLTASTPVSDFLDSATEAEMRTATGLEGNITIAGTKTWSGLQRATAQNAIPATPEEVMTGAMVEKAAVKSVFSVDAAAPLVIERVDNHGTLTGEFLWTNTNSGTTGAQVTILAGTSAPCVVLGKYFATGTVANGYARARSSQMFQDGGTKEIVFRVGAFSTASYPTTQFRFLVGIGNNGFTDEKSGMFFGVDNPSGSTPSFYQWLDYDAAGAVTPVATTIPFQSLTTGEKMVIVIKAEAASLTTAPTTFRATVYKVSPWGAVTLVGTDSVSYVSAGRNHRTIHTEIKTYDANNKAVHFNTTALRAANA